MIINSEEQPQAIAPTIFGLVSGLPLCGPFIFDLSN